MYSKFIVGAHPWLALAIEDCRLADTDVEVVAIPVDLDAEYRFVLDEVPKKVQTGATAFVAWGPKFLNFQRLELMGELKKLGYKMPPLISPCASVSSTAKIMENAWVQGMAFVGPGVSVGTNSVIGIQASLLQNCIIDKNVWIGARVSLSDGVTIGSNTILGDGVEVLSNVAVGKGACIERPAKIAELWPDGKFSLNASKLDGAIIDLSIR
jgi:UDP-3-O-[3-hydroxymyristoyl] glucosamine N-acyltransferase